MASRSLWTGSIAFGLVTIPIDLHRAIRDTRPRFRLLHAKDKSPVRFERVCQRDGHRVAWEDLVKGYEYEKGKFVVVTREDLAAATLEKTSTLDVIDFVAADQIDDRFFETPYYALPAKGGDKAYAVLREALRQTGKTGVGRIMLRDVEHLAALEAIGDALVVTMMRFPDELADLSDFRFPAASQARPKEVGMAKTLVDQLTSEWSPDKYTDEYQQNLMRLIRAKVKGATPKLPEEAPDPRHEKVTDLMERLQQSLGSGRGASRRRATTGERTPSARRRKTPARGGAARVA